MKKFAYFPLLLVGLLFFSTQAFAAGDVNQRIYTDGSDLKRLVFTCTGDAADGTIPNTAITSLRSIRDFYIRRVIIENLSTETDVTDDSDVYLRLNDVNGDTDTSGADLLDGNGVDQLDADTSNFIKITDVEAITGRGATLIVSNQSAVSAVFYITIVLAR